MPYVNNEEYKNLLDIKVRYDWLIKQALIGASINSYDDKRLYIRTGVLDEELRKYHEHDYNKRLHELKVLRNSKKGRKKYYGY